METKKIIGALVLFAGAFLVTRQILAKGKWTMDHYVALAFGLVFIAVGFYIVTRKPIQK